MAQVKIYEEVKRMLTNYHTHHYRCQHATGEVSDYVKEAVEQGYDILGMSCHMPYPNFPEMKYRMTYAELEDYFKDIEQANDEYQTITVLKSLECEYFAHLHEYYEALAQKTDYLIVAQHKVMLNGKLNDAFNFDKPEQLHAYADVLVEAFATQLFSLVAHPDVFGMRYPRWDEACEAMTHKIVAAALKYDVVLELNANGFRRGKKQYEDGLRYPYPVDRFWQIVATHYKEAKVIVNSDCHDPHLLNDEYVQQARDYAKAMQLNLIDTLPLK